LAVQCGLTSGAAFLLPPFAGFLMPVRDDLPEIRISRLDDAAAGKVADALVAAMSKTGDPYALYRLSEPIFPR
jgi:hypothetical protein